MCPASWPELGVKSRGEAAALARREGITAHDA